MTNASELACSYAALLLSSAEVEITEERLAKLTKAAKIKLDPLWLTLFSKALAVIDVKSLVESASSAAPASAAVAAAPVAETQAPAKEEKKDESEEEDDGDMGFGLFD